MSRINLKRISEILSDQDMKNITGGSFTCRCYDGTAQSTCSATTIEACESSFQQYCSGGGWCY